MFMQRLITSIILVPLVLSIIFFGNPWVLAGILLAVILVAGQECFQLIPIASWVEKITFISSLLIAVWVCGQVFSYWQSVGILVWLLVYVAIVTFPNSQKYWGYPIIVTLLCLLLLPLFIQSLARLYYLPQGKGLLVYLLFLVWSADIGAYLAGKQWGKHKLIPQVSPGKSWEGVTGGFVLALIISGISYVYFKPSACLIWFALAAVTVVVSIFGDLFISILKRRCHLKDTGSIIPGHGGILDRLDSLIAALPVFYLGLTYIPLGM